jgi:hypothetical protein
MKTAYTVHSLTSLISYFAQLKVDALRTTVRNDGPGENLRSKHVLVSAGLQPVTTCSGTGILLQCSAVSVRTATPR